MRKFLLFIFFVCTICIQILGQQVYITADDPDKQLADRLITLYGTTGDSIHTNTNMLSYLELSSLYKEMKQDVYEAKLSNADVYDISKFLYAASDYNLMAQDPLFKSPSNDGTYGFYNQTSYLFEKAGNFHLMFQPQAQAYGYIDNHGEFYFSTAAGMYARAKVGSRFGLYISGTYHRELLPSFYGRYVEEFQAMPGIGKFRTIDIDGYSDYQSLDYFLVNGHASFDLIQDRVTMSAGYSKFFIGDGIRSLILSDFGSPMPFVSFRTNFWKLEYTNLFFKANSQSIDYGLPGQNQNKYISLHYLSANLFPWLNVGLFETVVTSKNGGPEIGYFNPVIMYRAIERSYGSPDKMALGISVKATIKHHAQLYGQFFLNEFTAKEFFAGNGYIHNKWGAQIGGKYYNLFGVNNLDIQAEANFIRPFAYQHHTNSNFSSDNLPIAHPLGAGIKEYIGRASYRPIARLNIRGQLMYWEQGLDSADSGNYGSNILKNINNYNDRYGINMINGVTSKTLLGQLVVSYELFPEFYIEAGGAYRKQSTSIARFHNESYFGFLGFRFEMARKDLFQF